MNCYDIVGYTLDAEVYCPGCLPGEDLENRCPKCGADLSGTGHDVPCSKCDWVGDNPAVIFADMEVGDLRCDVCEEPLLEQEEESEEED